MTMVAGFELDAVPYSAILATHVDSVLTRRQFVSFALHIGGLNERHDEEYRRAMNSADVTYPDGASVTILARLAGAKQSERCPTTDLGPDIISEASRQMPGRRLRIALIGGTSEFIGRAHLAFEEKYGIEVVFTHNGYDPMTDAGFDSLRTSVPDVVVVGMGMPREAKFVSMNRSRLPECLLLTCGGWMGFVVGDELRAPRFLQRNGGEWMFRLYQSPRRLFWRYFSGVATFTSVAAGILYLRVDTTRKDR